MTSRDTRRLQEWASLTGDRLPEEFRPRESGQDVEE